eukprot:675061-Prorocentrum_lima.AAC.1
MYAPDLLLAQAAQVARAPIPIAVARAFLHLQAKRHQILRSQRHARHWRSADDFQGSVVSKQRRAA